MNFPTTHHFLDNTYVRRMEGPAGVMVVGLRHLKPHMLICAKGHCKMNTNGVISDMMAGDLVECIADTQRAVYFIEDTVLLTVHPSSTKDPDELYKELVDVDELAKFNFDNQPKKECLT